MDMYASMPSRRCTRAFMNSLLMSTSVLRLLCRHKKSDASATYHMRALYLRPAVPPPVQPEKRTPRAERRFDYSSQRETGGPPLRRPHRSYGTASKKSDTPTHLDFISLGFGDVSPNLLQSPHPAPHLKTIKPKAKRLCLPLLCRDARARGSSSFIKSRPPATYIIEHIKDSG